MTLQVELVSPERILFEGEAEMVIARTVGGGDIAFLTGHTPFLGALEIETVTVRPSSGPDEMIAVHGGFISVQHDRVVILSDVAEVASQIDVARAQAAEARAETAHRAEQDAEHEAALRRARARLKAAGAVSGTTAGTH
jgi:F-type H+-transporting ATPase subunit epsilon